MANPQVYENEIFRLPPRVTTTGKEFQDLDDFGDVEDYLNNDALKAFKNVDKVWEKSNGKIGVVKGSKIYSLSLEEFLDHYLIRPNHALAVSSRWSGYGSLCGNSRFSRIMEYAILLRDGGEPLHSFCPEDIKTMATEYSKLYADGREIGSQLMEHVRRLKYDRVGLLINHPETDWEAMARQDRTVHQHSLLFTFFKTDDSAEADITDMLGALFGKSNVILLGSVANSPYDKLLYCVEKRSFYNKDEFRAFLEKYGLRFSSSRKKVLRSIHGKEELEKKDKDTGFLRVSAEYFPTHIHSFDCVFKRGLYGGCARIKEFYHLNKLVKKVFDVDRVTVKKFGVPYVITVSKAFDQAVENMNEDVSRLAFELERRYSGDYRSTSFESPSIEIILTDSLPWSLQNLVCTGVRQKIGLEC